MGRTDSKSGKEVDCDICFPKQCREEAKERVVEHVQVMRRQCTLNDVLIGSAVGLVTSAVAGFAFPGAGIYTALLGGGSIVLVKLASYADLETNLEQVRAVIDFERDYTCLSSGLLGGLIVGGVGSTFAFPV